jgi:hypothetical protein
MALELFDLPPPLVVAAATAIGRNSTLQDLRIVLIEVEGRTTLQEAACNMMLEASAHALQHSSTLTSL